MIKDAPHQSEVRVAPQFTSQKECIAMESTTLPPLLTVVETAELLRLSPWRVYDLIRRGEIPSINLGRTLRVPRDLLLKRLGLGPPATGTEG